MMMETPEGCCQWQSEALKSLSFPLGQKPYLCLIWHGELVVPFCSSTAHDVTADRSNAIDPEIKWRHPISVAAPIQERHKERPKATIDVQTDTVSSSNLGQSGNVILRAQTSVLCPMAHPYAITYHHAVWKVGRRSYDHDRV